jgi:hypothetical protein
VSAIEILERDHDEISEIDHDDYERRLSAFFDGLRSQSQDCLQIRVPQGASGREGP